MRCHGLTGEDAIIWEMHIDCKDTKTAKEKLEHNSQKNFFQFVAENCHQFFTNPYYVSGILPTRTFCVKDIRTCDKSHLRPSDDVLPMLCDRFESPLKTEEKWDEILLEYTSQYYKNAFCAACNNVSEPLSCYDHSKEHIVMIIVKNILLDENPGNQLSLPSFLYSLISVDSLESRVSR